jgi:hypothetical protein
MPIDSYVQVAPDGSGKKIDMALTASAAGDTIYRQRAEIVGVNAEVLGELLELSRKQLACLRGILYRLNNGDLNDHELYQD